MNGGGLHHVTADITAPPSCVLLAVIGTIPVYVCTTRIPHSVTITTMAITSMSIIPRHVMVTRARLQLYTYENKHQDIKFILNSVQKYKMENKPINQNQPNWL